MLGAWGRRSHSDAQGALSSLLDGRFFSNPFRSDENDEYLIRLMQTTYRIYHQMLVHNYSSLWMTLTVFMPTPNKIRSSVHHPSCLEAGIQLPNADSESRHSDAQRCP